MKRVFLLLAAFCGVAAAAQEKRMDELWSEQSAKFTERETENIKLFRDGNFAMFIHWGLYSELASRWNGKTYYGISEWIMSPKMAGIPPGEYMPLAENFNPVNFDAVHIVSLAKAAGMKYILVGSKHHDGFAMYHSKASGFNICDATPFKRDPMKELSDECRRQGIGFGFYYSQSQDWTAPGAYNGPKTDSQGRPVGFEEYLEGKALPQIREILTGYGPVVIVWFDTPGGLERGHVERIIKEVRLHQPEALVSGRVGHDMGDYKTLGDMEIPLRNEDGLWETVDVTNDSWGYAWYDNNWRTPKTVVERLLSTIARGGTYMLNVGPKGDGSVPEQAAEILTRAGEWVAKYPYAVYGAESSPWMRALPWGDAVRQGDKLYLLVYDWPQDGKLTLHGLRSKIVSAKVMNGGPAVKSSAEGTWTTLQVPDKRPDRYVSVIELALDGRPVVDSAMYLDPVYPTTLNVTFGRCEGNEFKSKRWMEKFGEWIKVAQAGKWVPGSSVSWEVDVKEPGYYSVDMRYAGKGRVVWKLEASGNSVQNQTDCSHIYNDYKIGWIRFDRAGKHTLKASLVEGDGQSASLESVCLTAVDI